MDASTDILHVLDDCCDTATFPMLDNGYFYLAANRLSLYRSAADWGLVIETFGFSPRTGTPTTHIQTFASRLHDRDSPESHGTPARYEDYLRAHPHDEFRYVEPLGQIDWNDQECVAEDIRQVSLRGRPVPLPPRDEYGRLGIEFEEEGRVRIFELCRYLAAVARENVLATPGERRVSVRPDMAQLMQLEEWHHPNVVVGERPSGSRTFQQLARVLETGDVRLYEAADAPNTHWRNWPDGGTL